MKRNYGFLTEEKKYYGPPFTPIILLQGMLMLLISFNFVVVVFNLL